MQRVETKEKHEREIDMTETRERLHELFRHLSRNEDDGQGKSSYNKYQELC